MTNYLPSGKRFLGLDDDWADPDRAQAELIPVPYDVTSSYGRGSDKGPAAICDASAQLEMYDALLKCVPYQKWNGVVTAEPVPIYEEDSSEKTRSDKTRSDKTRKNGFPADAPCQPVSGAVLANRLEARVLNAMDRRRLVITLGGEHTSIVGAARAYSRRMAEKKQPLTILQFDAHSDLRESYEGTRWSHACAMARILDFHENIVQVGIRSQIEQERALTDARKIPVFYAEAIPREDIPDFSDWLDSLIDSLETNVYITFDCDSLDPSIVPATGTPEPGGINWRQINRIFQRIALQKNIVGMDFCELAPIEGLVYPQFTVAKLIHRCLGYINV